MRSTTAPIKLKSRKRIDRLHEALAQYLAQLSAQSANQPMNSDLEQVLGAKMNALSPQDLERMLDQMRDMSAAGARDAARNELAQLQQMLENLRTDRPQLSAEQQQALKKITALRDLTRKQHELLDKTFTQAQDGKADNNSQLSMQQEDIRQGVHSLLDNGFQRRCDRRSRSKRTGHEERERRSRPATRPIRRPSIKTTRWPPCRKPSTRCRIIYAHPCS